MTINPDVPAGAPVWMDLVTSEVESKLDFYGQVFGWKGKETPPDFEGYRYFEKDGHAVAGCMANQAEWNQPDAWSIFLRTDDAEKTERLAAENGGEVLMATMKVADNGSFCILRDPGGAVISAWQPDQERGFGVLGETNTPAHFELHTRDYEKSIDFYREVFGWVPQTLGDEPGFLYTGFGSAEDPKAGIMDATAFLPADSPAKWSVYIAVADVDSTIEQATGLGATVVQPAQDTPYGRLATIADPTGAVLKLQGQQ